MNLIGDIFVGLIILVIIVYAWIVFRAKDKALIWSPLSFVLLTYAYYIVMPYFAHERDSVYGFSIDDVKYLTVFAAFLHLFFFIVGMAIKCPVRFQKFNALISEEEYKRYAIALFLISYLIYLPFGGFRISIFTQDDGVSNLEGAGGIAYYALNTIAAFTVSCCLLLTKIKENRWLILLIFSFTAITYIIGGFRFRLVFMAIAVLTFYYLYDLRRKINWLLIIPSAVAILAFFVVMEFSRGYGNGLNYDKVTSLSAENIVASNGPIENRAVFEFSSLTMRNYQEKDPILFEPIWCAVTMPIPRSIFPAKPEADYLKESEMEVYGTLGFGCAMFDFVEGYMAFGWLGVCLYGLFFGLLSGIYWNNYRENRNSLVAVTMLATYNGMTYFIISRGYLAGVLTTFVFYMLVPYWIALLYQYWLNRGKDRDDRYVSAINERP